VVVGTPGRLAELLRGGALQLHRCPLLIMDEADQLLGAAFSEDMTHVAMHAGKRVARQTVGAPGRATSRPPAHQLAGLASWLLLPWGGAAMVLCVLTA
jgi:hypothetical protein